MERSVWTDERLDDMVAMNERRFEEFENRMDRLERRMDEGFREIRSEIAAMNARMLHAAIVMFASQLSLFLTLLVRGG